MDGEPDIVQIDHIFSLEIGWGPVILSARLRLRLSVLHLIGFLVNFNHDTEIELLAKKWSNSEAHAATDLVQHLWVCLARHYGLVYVIGMPNDQLLQQQTNSELGVLSWLFFFFLVAQLSRSQEFRCQMDAQWKIAHGWTWKDVDLRPLLFNTIPKS